MALLKVGELAEKKIEWEEGTLIDVMVDGRKFITSVGTAVSEFGNRNVLFFTSKELEIMSTDYDFESSGEVIDVFAANMDWHMDTVITIHDGNKTFSMPASEMYKDIMHRKIRFFYGDDVVLLPKEEEE